MVCSKRGDETNRFLKMKLNTVWKIFRKKLIDIPLFIDRFPEIIETVKKKMIDYYDRGIKDLKYARPYIYYSISKIKF